MGFDRLSQATVQARPIGFELRLVCHRPDQRLPESVLGTCTKLDLLDEFRRDQRRDVGFIDQGAQKGRVET